MCRLNHTICFNIKAAGGGNGVGIVPLKKVLNKTYCILPVEKYGTYRDQYNICSGSMEEKDRGCYLLSMARELREELKIKLVDPRYMDLIGNLLKHKIKWFLHRTTPIFIINVDHDFSTAGGMRPIDIDLKTINSNIYIENSNFDLPFCYKEIQYADYIDLDTQQPVNYIGNLSLFAKGVLRKIRQL